MNYYESSSERTFWVGQGIVAGEPDAPWFTLYSTHGKKGTHRLKSPSLTYRETERQAQFDLDQYAMAHGFEAVEEEAEESEPKANLKAPACAHCPNATAGDCTLDCSIIQKCADCMLPSCAGCPIWGGDRLEDGLTYCGYEPASLQEAPSRKAYYEPPAEAVKPMSGMIEVSKLQLDYEVLGEPMVGCIHCPAKRFGVGDNGAMIGTICLDPSGSDKQSGCYVEPIQEAAPVPEPSTKTYGCISKPFRAYGDGICPETPDGTGQCCGCYAWKEVAVTETPEIVTEDAEIVTETHGSGYDMVPIKLLAPNPNNPRKHFDEVAMAKLTESIKQVGILEPILCVKENDPYLVPYGLRIVAGERRYRAAMDAGLHEVPVIVRELTEQQEFEIMLIENIQRADLDPIEEAVAFKAAVDRGWKQEQLADKLGISQAQVANRLRLLKLPEDVQQNISHEIMSPSQALMLVRVAHKPELVKQLAQKLTGVPVAGTEDVIDNFLRNQCYPTPLCSGQSWRTPKFDPDAESCSKCPERVLIKCADKKQHPFCMDSECWEKKQHEAEEIETQESVRAAFGDEVPADVLWIKDMDYHSYSRLGERDPKSTEECSACEHIKSVMDYGGEGLIDVCMNPDCMEEKMARVREVMNQERADAAKAWRAEKQELINAGYNASTKMPLIPLVFMAATAVMDADENCCFKGANETILNGVYNHFGWPIPTDEESCDGDGLAALLVERLKRLKAVELIQIIYYAMLTPLSKDDEVFNLTLGAAGEDGVH